MNAPDCSAFHGLCNCPNCSTNNCPNADDTRLHGAAVALMGLLDAFEHDGGDVEQLLFLAQTWRDQEAMKREIAHAPDCAVAMNARHDCSCGQNPTGQTRPTDGGK